MTQQKSPWLLLRALSLTFTRVFQLAACWIRVKSCSRRMSSLWPAFLSDWALACSPCLFIIGKPKQKAMGKAVKTPSLTWMEALPPPPPLGELEQRDEPDEQPPEHEDMDLGWVSHTNVSINEYCSAT